MSVFDRVKAAAQVVTDKAREWADAGIDKLKETVDALVASSAELPRVGYRLTDLELELSITPRIIVCLVRDREAGEEEFQALLAMKQDSSTFTALVKLLQQANAMDRRLKPRGRCLAGLRGRAGSAARAEPALQRTSRSGPGSGRKPSRGLLICSPTTMKLNLLTRRVHYWSAILAALPLLIVVGSGILLQLKKQVHWVQPPEKRGSGKEPALGFTRILDICRTVPEAEVRSWDDISRIDVRPSRGMMKVQAKNSHEIQIDAATGDVLQVAYRRSDIIESIHDGSWFHDTVKFYVFLPAAVMLLMLWLTGMYLFWLPIIVRARRKRRGPGERGQ